MSSLKEVRERKRRAIRIAKQKKIVNSAQLPHARTTDPDTSHVSAAITEKTTLASEVEKVAEAVRAAGKRGLASWELNDNKYWRRFNDAKKDGLIFPTGQKRWNPKTKRDQGTYVAKEWKP
jgi:hypothetical protein